MASKTKTKNQASASTISGWKPVSSLLIFCLLALFPQVVFSYADKDLHRFLAADFEHDSRLCYIGPGNGARPLEPQRIVRPSRWRWAAFLGTAGGMVAGYRLLSLKSKPLPLASASLLAGAGSPWIAASAGAADIFSRRLGAQKRWRRILSRSPFYALALAGTLYAGDALATHPDSARIIYPDSATAKPLRAAFIGDSLSKDFHISSKTDIALQARYGGCKDSVLDSDPANEVLSLFERLGTRHPVSLTHYARPGACVDSANIPVDPSVLSPSSICKVQCFSAQVDRILAEEEFPDLVLIWIGHNNIDWLQGALEEERKNPGPHLERIASSVEFSYRAQIGRLLVAAEKQNKKTAVVIFGLINFSSFFQARRAAEEYKARKDPSAYPFLEECYQRFEALKPENRNNMVLLASDINNRLRRMAEGMKTERFVDLSYSDALATADVSDISMVHPQDAWHPSPKAHSYLAQQMMRSLVEKRRGNNGEEKPSVLEFLENQW